MLSAIPSSLSALHAYGQKLGVTADNIANVNTPGYRRKTTSFSEGPQGDATVQIRRSNQTVEGHAGTAKARQEITQPPSNVNLVEEIPSLSSVERAYEANAKVIQTEDNMLGTLLDTFG